MRALLCRAWGPIDGLTLAEVPAPKPGPGELLIAVKATAVNYAEGLLTDRQAHGKIVVIMESA